MSRWIIVCVVLAQVSIITLAITLLAIGTGARSHPNFSNAPGLPQSFLVLPDSSPPIDQSRISQNHDSASSPTRFLSHIRRVLRMQFQGTISTWTHVLIRSSQFWEAHKCYGGRQAFLGWGEGREWNWRTPSPPPQFGISYIRVGEKGTIRAVVETNKWDLSINFEIMRTSLTLLYHLYQPAPFHHIITLWMNIDIFTRVN